MVGSWKDDRVKLNGVSFMIIEEVILTVSKILIKDFNFFRDKKLSANTVQDFVKDMEELKALKKIKMYYVPNTMKKLWMYVLRAVIKYITLDPRFDKPRTHHFVLLNHFWHSRKISFPFYLLTSMSKAVVSFKKKPTNNPALHEGLLLLIYEHFKAQTISNAPPQTENVTSGNSSFSSDSDDIQSFSSKDGRISSTDKIVTLQVKNLPSSIPPSRKSPRGHG